MRKGCWCVEQMELMFLVCLSPLVLENSFLQKPYLDNQSLQKYHYSEWKLLLTPEQYSYDNPYLAFLKMTYYKCCKFCFRWLTFCFCSQCHMIVRLYFDVVMQFAVGRECNFVPPSSGISRVHLTASWWCPLIRCLFPLKLVENCFFQLSLRQGKLIANTSFEQRKQQSKFCLFIENVSLIHNFLLSSQCSGF